MKNFEFNFKIRTNEELIKRVTDNARAMLAKSYDDIASNTYSMHFYGSAILDSVDNNICLWRLNCYKRGDKLQLYFYTNLEGNILFDNSFFEEATTFSEECSLVDYDGSNWYIINLKKGEKMQIPKDRDCKLFKNFMYNSMAILDSNTKKWGSYSLDLNKRLCKKEIPFIWDYLALSREKDYVYAGVTDTYSYKPNYEYSSYNHMISDYDKIKTGRRLKIAKMLKKDAYDMEYFKNLEKNISEYEWRGMITRYLEYYDPYTNPGDQYFNENDIFCTNDNSIIPIERTNNFEKTFCKVIK